MVTGDTKKKDDISKKIVSKKNSATPKDPVKSVPLKKSVAEPSVKDPSMCCPEFKPKPWDEKEIKWDGKFFVKDTIISAFHIPLNFKSVVEKNVKKIDTAKSGTKNPVIVVDELSPFHSHIYISVTKPVADCNDVKLTGQFLSKVFEGPYSKMKSYIKEMNEYVKSKGKITKKNYFFYPTCPKCSKKYGKNYTVILAEY